LHLQKNLFQFQHRLRLSLILANCTNIF
jgi:hypothetical protein